MTDTELDALIAEKVMGWKLLVVQDPSRAINFGDHFENWVADNGDGPGMYAPYEWKPSESIDLAMKVVEKMGDWDGFDFMLTHQFKNHIGMRSWSAGFVEYNDDGSYEWHALGEHSTSPARAICLAALKAMGVEIHD